MFSEDSTFRKGPGGLLFAQIENDLAKATVCLQGAQLTHWQPRSQAEPVTFMSATVQYVTRGGWRQLVCIESANARDNTLTLAAGQSHCLAVQYRAEPI